MMMKRYILHPTTTPAKSKIDYSAQLNEQQYEVVTSGEGPCLVLAGPGSGKTRTLIYRVAYLLDKGVLANNILLVTFTNKAAREMLIRLESLVGYSPKGLWGGTFHHIGNLILRRYANRLDYNPDYTILDREDARDLLDDCRAALGVANREARFPTSQVLQRIFELSSNCRLPLQDIVLKNYPQFYELLPQIEKLHTLYQSRKKRSNLMDYDDLLTNWLALLENYPDIKEYLSQQFRYILVDEFQDTNKLQFEILIHISSYHRNIMVVGDDSQSIYSFRGAEIGNILDFPRHFPDAKEFRLEINYRSTPEILELANRSIEHNRLRFPKTLRAVKEKSGIKPALIPTQDLYQQASFVAQRILELHEEGVPLSEIAVLFRARFQSAELELELAKRNIPYTVRGGLRFFEQAHIKDALAFLKILSNPRDELAWKRALKLQEGIGARTADKIWQYVAQAPNPVGALLSEPPPLPTRAKNGFSQFLRIMRAIDGLKSNPSEAIKQVVSLGYRDYVLFTFPNPNERLLDLEQLATLAASYGSLKKFLADITLHEHFSGESFIAPPHKEEEFITLSTLHQAKGLEWHTVFIIGLCEGAFPVIWALNNEERLEEERRLFYVGITRAKQELYLVYPIQHYTYSDGAIINRPSRFIEELPTTCYETWQIETG